ncbi:MAG: hypothetical protein JNL40_10020 [Cyclobacteriaceae bacterium]|nr:hypothetical protein [Cyclobacteriaceae bacterium]
MTESSTTKLPTSFWVISAVALVWNCLGAVAYLMQVTMSAETLQAMPEAERAMYTDIPVWATAAFAIAVWGGVLGSVLLLLRKKAATTVFVVSLAGILVQMVHAFFISANPITGASRMVMPLLVVAIGAYLFWFSSDAGKKGWLS